MSLSIAKFIDHTLLRPEATAPQIRALCDEARDYGFASVCINPCFALSVYRNLDGSGVKTCSVVGFPLGANDMRTKVFETERLIGIGVHEIDMVINIGALRCGASTWVGQEIGTIRKAVPRDRVLKVIIESAALSEDEIRLAAILCIQNGADFVKTSTGFHPAGGAKIEHVRLIKATIGSKAGIKASGGIKTYDQMMGFVEAGATRIGTSSGVSIIEEVMGSQASS